MKRIVLILLALTLGLSLQAKKDDGRGQFGIIGGLTSSNAKVSSLVNDIKSKNLNLYNVGLCFKQPLVLGFAIQPALIWNVKGAGIYNGGYGGELQTGFIEIPVQVQWGKSFLAGVLRPYLFAEPFVGVAVWDKAKGTEISDWNSIRNRFEVGMGVGLGIEIIKHIQVSCRYFWNFNPIYKGVEDGSNIKISNSGISLTAAILF